jgi:hypothetical protein
MKNQTSSSPAEHTGWNRLLILVIAVALLCIGYLTVIQNTFASAAKLQVFLHDAKAFNYTADIVKAEISDRLPQKIKDNVIEQALIAKFMDFVITPDNVERLSGPGLTLIYKAADTPTSIVNNKVVIDTTTYKSQAASYIAGLKLPDAISGPGQDLVNSVPTQLTLVDNSKHPNNPLALLIHLRDGLRTVRTVITVAWWAVVLALLTTLILNLRNIKRLSKSLAWGFGIPAVIIVIGSWLFPVLIQVFGPKSTDPIIGDSTNGLINSIVTNMFAATRTFGLVCLAIAVVSSLVYLFVPLQKVQSQLDILLNKIHKQPTKKHPKS